MNGSNGEITDTAGDDRWLKPAEVASMFRVDPKTVTRWAANGKIGAIRTPGGHRRFKESEIRALLDGDTPDPRLAGQPAAAG